MPEHEANCEDCPWSYSGEDLVEVSDQMERHIRKEQHKVDLQRAVATDGGVDQPKIWEASIDGHIVADCPRCLDPMLLGEVWRELILDEGHDVPECPDCDDGEGDTWGDDADVKLDGTEFWALAGDVIRPQDTGAEKVRADGGTDVRIAFANEYVEPILNGEKAVTARYDFDRALRPGDEIECRTEEGEPFATARLDAITETTVAQFAAARYAGHRTYDTVMECAEHLQEYYPEVDFRPNTTLTVLTWSPASVEEVITCIECGAEIENEAHAVFGSGGVTEEGKEVVENGGSGSADDLFAFDDGPYCSADCMLSVDEGGAGDAE